MSQFGGVLQLVLFCSWCVLNVHGVHLPNADAHVRVQQTRRHNSQTAVPRHRKHVRAFVGVMTGYKKAGLAADVYKDRRDALRATWFPATPKELKRWETEYGIVIRFVIGRSDEEAANWAIEQEAAVHQDFLRMDNQEDYMKFSNKTRTFFRTAYRAYSADWYIKMDDDMYVRPHHLRAAINGWDDKAADYVGCINRNAPVIKTPGQRWYEHNHDLIGNHYWTYFKGAFYALRGYAVKTVIVNNFDSLRLLHSNEDACLGLWVLGHNMKHYDDQRLCHLECKSNTVAVIPDYWTDVTGHYMRNLHSNNSCRS